MWTRIPLYSKKLHMRVLRARTSCVTSLTIFAFAFCDIVIYHLARRTFPTPFGQDRSIAHSSQGGGTLSGNKQHIVDHYTETTGCRANGEDEDKVRGEWEWTVNRLRVEACAPSI